MKLKSFFIFLLVVPMTAYSILGEDTALMMELVSNTAKEINELEKLVSNAEKYTQKMREYNELMEDEYFKAERIKSLAESLASKKEIQNLGDYNQALRELKYSMEDLETLMKEYGAIKGEEKKAKAVSKIKEKEIEKDREQAQRQVARSIGAKTQARSSQITAQNTALLYESNLEVEANTLKLIENTATTNRLLAEKLEEERAKEIQKRKYYGLKDKKD